MNTKNQEQAPKKRLCLRIKKSTMWALLALIIFKIVLDLSYCFMISPVWSYAGLELHLNSLKLVESYLLLFIVFVMMPKSAKKLSNILVWLLIVFSYIPMLTIFALKDEARAFIYAVSVFWAIVFLLLHMPSLSLAPLRQSGIIRYCLFICLGLIVFLTLYKYLGLSFNFDLTKVYDIRRQYVATGIPLAGYLFNWVAYIVNPVFFALCIAKRKWLPVALIVVLQLLLFSATGNKTYLFALPLVLALIWVVTRRNPLAYLGIGLVSIVLLGMLSHWLIDDVWISSLFARRTLLVPAQLSFCYYDFFSTNGYTYLSQHRLFQTFSDYPYHLDPAHLIGEVYFAQPETGANNGLAGDAFMNFGFTGLALWAILLAIILRLVDSCSKRVNPRVGVAAIALPAVTLTNSALLTNLLTHGLLLTLLLLYLLPKEVADR